MGEASEQFKEQLRREFDRLQVGHSFTFRRTFTDGDVALFCGVTGDYNPFHLDDAFAQETWFGRRIIPGLLTGSMITHIGGMLGFLAANMTFEYLAPVFVADTVTCVVTITERDVERRRVVGSARFTNERGVEVLRAGFSGFPAQVRLTPNT